MAGKCMLGIHSIAAWHGWFAAPNDSVRVFNKKVLLAHSGANAIVRLIAT
jgi:hypothetical protein